MPAELRITCPKCRTEYLLSREYLKGRTAVRLRCSRCQHEFRYPVQKRPARKTAAEETTGETHSELPFSSVTEPTDSDEVGTGEEEAEPAVEDDRPSRRPAATAPRERRRTLAEEEEDIEDDDRFVLSEEEEPTWRIEPAPEEKRPPRRPRAAAVDPATRDAGKVRAVLVVLALVVSVYAVLALTLIAQPRKARAVVEKIPLVGRGLSEERIYRSRVQLVGVSASLQRLRGGREVLVISGRAVNRNPVPLREVQIAGKVFGPAGRLLEEKRVFCGNVVTVKMLRDLNAQEISMLQQNPPVREFTLRPGESTEFMVVLSRVKPEEAKEAQLEVVSVRRQV